MTNRPNRWRRRLSAAVAAVAALSVASGALASSHVVYQQDFTTDASGWNEWIGIAQGTITHNQDAGTATFAGIANGRGDLRGPASFFGNAWMAWPTDFIAEIDVYLDPAWDVGQGFDYRVAPYVANLFTFHVGVVADGRLLVNGSRDVTYGRTLDRMLTGNHPSFDPGANPGVEYPGDVNYTVAEAGWYTLQHVFGEEDGFLVADLNLLDAGGEIVWTATIRSPDQIDGEAIYVHDGGNVLASFYHIDAPRVEVDNHKLYLVEQVPATKDDCKKGSFEAFGFENQGQCVASVSANESAGK